MKISLIGFILNDPRMKAKFSKILTGEGKPVPAEVALDFLIQEYVKLRLGGKSNVVSESFFPTREFKLDHSTKTQSTLPTIHLNGTGAETLLAEYTALAEAIQNATTALEHATCNARDFYPQDDDAWNRASAERSEMFQKLEDLQSYASAWAIEASRHIRTHHAHQS